MNANIDPTRGTGGWPLFFDDVDTQANKRNVFSSDELDEIVALGESTHFYDIGRDFHPTQRPNGARESLISFFFPNPATDFIFRRLTDLILEVNAEHFRFDITSIEQGLQFSKYVAPYGHFSWHMDRSPGLVTRKLSITVQLTDPSEYDGGDLQILPNISPETVEKERGLVTFFPSYILHRVKTVTRGTRHSLVCWVNGPPFK